MDQEILVYVSLFICAALVIACAIRIVTSTAVVAERAKVFPHRIWIAWMIAVLLIPVTVYTHAITTATFVVGSNEWGLLLLVLTAELMVFHCLLFRPMNWLALKIGSGLKTALVTTVFIFASVSAGCAEPPYDGDCYGDARCEESRADAEEAGCNANAANSSNSAVALAAIAGMGVSLIAARRRRKH